MAYRFDPRPAYDQWPRVAVKREVMVILVGCGGTGSFLAESVCRLLINQTADLYLVDLDRVEPHNVGRQAFDPADVGRFKAQVLAERLSRRFRRPIGYAVQPYDRTLYRQILGQGRSQLNLLLGCVDNAEARRTLAATLDGRTDVVWLDCGNGRNSGQVLVGNATQSEMLRRAFVPKQGLCHALPAPSLQRPDLLDAPPAPPLALDCAEAVARAEQGATINQVVAAVAASYIEKLLAGTCSWMATYFDLDDGTLRCVLAEPKTVAQLVGLHPNAVVSRRAEVSG